MSDAELRLRYSNTMPPMAAMDSRTRVLATNDHIARGGGSWALAAFKLYPLGISIVAIRGRRAASRQGERFEAYRLSGLIAAEETRTGSW